jgi:hypothetical protein
VQKFGDIVDTAEDDEASVVIHFKTRRFAEAAINSGKKFGDKFLSMSW